jgi:hypothetical protein
MDDLVNTARCLHAAREAAGRSSSSRWRTGTREAAGSRMWVRLKALPLDDVAVTRHGPIGVGELGLTHVDGFIEFGPRGYICQPTWSAASPAKRRQGGG